MKYLKEIDISVRKVLGFYMEDSRGDGFFLCRLIPIRLVQVACSCRIFSPTIEILENLLDSTDYTYDLVGKSKSKSLNKML